MFKILGQSCQFIHAHYIHMQSCLYIPWSLFPISCLMVPEDELGRWNNIAAPKMSGT